MERAKGVLAGFDRLLVVVRTVLRVVVVDVVSHRMVWTLVPHFAIPIALGRQHIACGCWRHGERPSVRSLSGDRVRAYSHPYRIHRE